LVTGISRRKPAVNLADSPHTIEVYGGGFARNGRGRAGRRRFVRRTASGKISWDDSRISLFGRLASWSSRRGLRDLLCWGRAEQLQALQPAQSTDSAGLIIGVMYEIRRAGRTTSASTCRWSSAAAFSSCSTEFCLSQGGNAPSRFSAGCSRSGPCRTGSAEQVPAPWRLCY